MFTNFCICSTKIGRTDYSWIMHFDHNMRDMLAQIVRQKNMDYDYKKNDTYLLIFFLKLNDTIKREGLELDKRVIMIFEILSVR